MKHLHFTQSLEPLYGGGLGSSALALHRQMLSMRIDSTLCATRGGEVQTNFAGTHEFRRIKPDFVYYSPKLRRAGKDLVSSADILHGHGLYVGTNYIFGTEARRQQKPMVYHVHGMFEPYILARSQWKKRLVHWLFEDANFQNVRLWRALTTKEADQIRGCRIAGPIVIAPNGLNLSDYKKPAQCLRTIQTPLVPQLSKKGPRVLFLSRIHPKKGLDVLLPAWGRILTRCNDWELVVAGPDEQGYLAVVQTLTEKLGLRDKVVFTGPVAGQAKIELLYSADLFALPSYSEGLPVSLLEAMACEVPVVASKACNCPDIHTAGAGWLCEPELDSLIKTLSEAIGSSKSEREQRGLNGKRLVEQAYSWPKIASDILKACEAYCC
jgi:glycosyltransferase involved in cell wall biosynthesis